MFLIVLNKYFQKWQNFPFQDLNNSRWPKNDVLMTLAMTSFNWPIYDQTSSDPSHLNSIACTSRNQVFLLLDF